MTKKNNISVNVTNFDPMDSIQELKMNINFMKGVSNPLPISNIEGLLIKDLKQNVDDRGILYEAVRIDWYEYISTMSSENAYHFIRQIYIVRNESDAIRAYHKHYFLIDLFCIVEGKAKFIFVDDRVNSPTFGNMMKINVSSRNPQIIFVPAGVYHGWRAPAGTILMSAASEMYKGYNKEKKLDEHRIDPFTFGNIWEIEHK